MSFFKKIVLVNPIIAFPIVIGIIATIIIFVIMGKFINNKIENQLNSRKTITHLREKVNELHIQLWDCESLKSAQADSIAIEYPGKERGQE